MGIQRRLLMSSLIYAALTVSILINNNSIARPDLMNSETDVEPLLQLELDYV